MNELYAFLNRYSRRDQLAILSLGLAVALLLVWLLVLSPIQKKRDQLFSANQAATQTLGKVQLMVAQIKQARAQGASAGSGENINALIDSSLRANGLSMSGFQPGTAGEVRLRLDRAPYNALVAWLYDMELNRGITVKDLSIASTNDAGIVTVNLRLQKAN